MLPTLQDEQGLRGPRDQQEGYDDVPEKTSTTITSIGARKSKGKETELSWRQRMPMEATMAATLQMEGGLGHPNPGRDIIIAPVS